MADVKKRIAILISGRGSNMKAILDNVRDGTLEDCCEVAVVAANKPDAPGLATARARGVETLCVESAGKTRPEFEKELLEALEPYRLDYLVLAGFMRVLSPLLVRRYANRIINIHPADTAHYRGAHGYRWAYENNLPSTLITVHYVDESVDTGPVIAQRQVDLTGATTLEEVERRGLSVEHVFYSEVLWRVFTGDAAAT